MRRSLLVGLVGLVVLGSILVSRGVAEGGPLPPHDTPGGTIDCSTHVVQASYSTALSASGGAGAFTAHVRGLFGGCTGNTGGKVLGGTYTWNIHTATGPRTCTAATSGTFGGPNALKVTWWVIDQATGQAGTYSSTSHTLVSTSAAGLAITVRWTITSGPFAGKTITGTGTVTQPQAFLADCAGAGLQGTGLTGGAVTVP